MKITEKRLRQIIKEEIELLREFRVPPGFSPLRALPIPGRDSDQDFLMHQEREGIIGPMEYNQNNGVIVVIPARGGASNASVWIPSEKGGADDSKRAVPYRDAIDSVKAAGYKLNTNLYVPFSN